MNKLSKIKKTAVLECETGIMKYGIAYSVTLKYMKFKPVKLMETLGLYELCPAS